MLLVVVTGIWGGLLALERRAFLQAMISRPLVAATVTGLIHDDALAGLMVGVVFELVHLGGASLGGAHPDHDTLPAVAGAALAAGMGASSGSASTPAIWAFALLMCTPLGRAGLWLEHRLDARARRYYGVALEAAKAGEIRRAARQNVFAMWPQFVFYGLIAAGAAFIGPRFEWFFQQSSPTVLRGLAWAYPAMGLAASVAALRGSHATRRVRVGVVIGVLGAVGLLVHGVAS